MDIDFKRLEEHLDSYRHQWSYHKHCPKDLLSALQNKLPELPPNSWPQRFSLGGVFVNGKRQWHNIPLTAPCKIEYFEPKFSPDNWQEFFPPHDPNHLLYQDEDLLVVYKPAGLPSLPGREQVKANLKNYWQQHQQTPLHLPSRLDKSVAGIVIISRSQKMHNLLQKAFQKRKITKYYLLQLPQQITWPTQTISHPIANDPRHPVLRKLASPNEVSQPAETQFSFLKSGQFITTEQQTITTSYLIAQPITGRTHQIRLHATSLGSPIIGDAFYQGLQANTLHLLSYRIVYFHPLQQRYLDIYLPERLWPEWSREGLSNLNCFLGH